MGLSFKKPARRRTFWARVVLGLLVGLGMLAVIGVTVIAVAIRAAMAAAAQAVGTILAQFAAYVMVLMMVATAVLILSVMLFLQTPPLALPFGPVARLGGWLLRAWLASAPG